MHKTITYIKAIIVLVMMIVHSIFWCTLLFIVFLPKAIVYKHPNLVNKINVATEWLGRKWVKTNDLILRYISRVKFTLHGTPNLDTQKQYFVTCNHQSWSDILILQSIFLNKIAFIRFFIKKQLMWLPFLNIAWWAYDFPIMHRASKQELEKKPHLRGKDMLATQKSCAKFKHRPLTLLNFLEGTRFTTQKHQKQQSPYKHLLKPKAGGLAFAMSALDHSVVNIIDVTIIYPDFNFNFMDFLGGTVKNVNVYLHERQVPTHLLGGNYTEDPVYKQQFQDWVALIWDHKDKLIIDHKKRCISSQ